MHQHDRHQAGVAQPIGGQPQHLGAAALHREIVERALVRRVRECSGQPSNSDTIDSLQHRALHHLGAPRPERRVALLMPDDDFAGDHRMPAEPARQRHDAHAVVDAELQRLHPLALRLAFRSSPSSVWRRSRLVRPHIFASA